MIAEMIITANIIINVSISGKPLDILTERNDGSQYIDHWFCVCCKKILHREEIRWN